MGIEAPLLELRLRIKGLIGERGREGLMDTLTSLFQRLLAEGDEPAPPPNQMERAFRKPQKTTEEGPGDVICSLWDYATRDRIIKRAWVLGPFDFQGREVKIMPELSGSTLRRRVLMRPLLGHLKAHGLTYWWGTPHHLVVRRQDELFFVQCPADLLELFGFLAIPRIQVPDWLQPLPTPARRRPR